VTPAGILSATYPYRLESGPKSDPTAPIVAEAEYADLNQAIEAPGALYLYCKQIVAAGTPASAAKYVNPSDAVIGVAIVARSYLVAATGGVGREAFKTADEFVVQCPPSKLYDAAVHAIAGIVTVKFVADVPVTPPTATVITPVVAPVGTVVVIEVAVDAVTIAVVPLNCTVLLAAVVLKFVPVMVTVAPTAPVAGAKLVIVGVDAVVTV
jgi:hypothetical protein